MRIEHIAVYVNNLEGAKEFFEKYFNAVSGEMYHNKNTGFQSYFLSFESGSRLEIMTKSDIVQIENSTMHTGYIHLAFSVGSRGNVNSVTEKLKADGYKILSGPRITGDGYYESCVVGFENNIIEITI
ncbi:MAG: VOC family protein [Ruminococcus sp.]|nr:VOC family protein [Ruminococcus sp.]